MDKYEELVNKKAKLILKLQGLREKFKELSEEISLIQLQLEGIENEMKKLKNKYLSLNFHAD